MERPTPSLEEWVRKVEADSKGRSYASLFWQTLDGFAVPPLTTGADTASLPHLEAVGILGARRGFAIHELVTAAEPAAANTAARRALARGADEVELSLDALGQDALEPVRPPGDEDFVADWTAPGEGGVAIHSRPDLDAALCDLDLAKTHLSFSAGEGALPILAWWLRRADALGVPRQALRGGLDVDPIARLTMRQVELIEEETVVSRRAAVEPVFGEAMAALRTCATHCPEVRPLVVDGQVFHLAGASPAVELGATIASAIEVARRLGARGATFDEFARATTVRVQVSHELLPEIAKLRALRLLWAKVAQAFGGQERTPRLLGITSGRFRAELYDQRTNLIRSALSGFAAVVGGCDAVIALPFAEGAGQGAADIARDQLHLLRAESHLDRVADPAGGSFAVETLTGEIGRRAWQLVQDIEREGGLLATVRNGFLGERLRVAEAARELAFRTRRRVLVGVSRFPDRELGGPVEAPDAAGDAGLLLERHAEFSATRDAERARRVAAAVASSAADRVFEHSLGEDADHATLAELATATWPPEEVVYRHLFLPVAVGDGHEFEELRANTDELREDGRTIPKVLLVPFGARKIARARAGFARELFEVADFEIEDPGYFDDLDAAAASIRAAGAGIAVLCGEDALYADAADALRTVLGDAMPRLIVAGRIDEGLAARVDGSIHAGMDTVAFLADLQARLGLTAEGS